MARTRTEEAVRASKAWLQVTNRQLRHTNVDLANCVTSSNTPALIKRSFCHSWLPILGWRHYQATFFGPKPSWVVLSRSFSGAYR